MRGNPGWFPLIARAAPPPGLLSFRYAVAYLRSSSRLCWVTTWTQSSGWAKPSHPGDASWYEREPGMVPSHRPGGSAAGAALLPVCGWAYLRSSSRLCWVTTWTQSSGWAKPSHPGDASWYEREPGMVSSHRQCRAAAVSALLPVCGWAYLRSNSRLCWVTTWTQSSGWAKPSHPGDASWYEREPGMVPSHRPGGSAAGAALLPVCGWAYLRSG